MLRFDSPHPADRLQGDNMGRFSMTWVPSIQLAPQRLVLGKRKLGTPWDFKVHNENAPTWFNNVMASRE